MLSHAMVFNVRLLKIPFVISSAVKVATVPTLGSVVETRTDKNVSDIELLPAFVSVLF